MHGSELLFFPQIFRQINVVLLKNFNINCFDEKKLHGSEFLVFPHCVIGSDGFIVWKLHEFTLSRIFGKNFVKVTVLLVKYLDP